MLYPIVELSWGTGISDKIEFRLDQQSEADSYSLRGISGLEPPPIDVIIANKQFEGGLYQGRRPQQREIVMVFGFNPDYSVGETTSSLRKKLYNLLTPKLNANVMFRLYNEAKTTYFQATGQVKNIEANPFSKDPEIQITMSCYYPHFDGAVYLHPTPASLNGLNPLPITHEGGGDAPTGLDITFKLTAATTLFRLYNANSSRYFRIDYSFAINDQIRIDTINGERKVDLTRGATTSSLLPYIYVGSTWHQLAAGVNNFIPNVTTYQVVSARHIPKHWGF